MAQILLVDDDESFRKMLRMLLQSLGHEVVEVCDGAKAWTAYNGSSFDLIVMDLIMPEQEGIETLQKFRKNKIDVKILAISGGGRSNPRDLLSAAKIFGANATLAKPFSHDDFVTVINQLLPARG